MDGSGGRATSTRSRRAAPALLGALLLALLCHGSGRTQPSPGVDTALILAVDVSNSVDAARYRLQLGGIADALEDPSVQAALLGGPQGSIAVAVVLWADRPTLSIPWVRISDAAAANALAGRVRRLRRLNGEFTCVAQLLRFVADKMSPQIPVRAARVVLDVSGDGKENCNPEMPPLRLRDDLIALGLTINGLPILEGGDAETLELWYRENVAGGPGSFIVPARGFEDFGRAFRQKFITEVSGGDPATAPVPGPRTARVAR